MTLKYFVIAAVLAITLTVPPIFADSLEISGEYMKKDATIPRVFTLIGTVDLTADPKIVNVEKFYIEPKKHKNGHDEIYPRYHNVTNAQLFSGYDWKNNIDEITAVIKIDKRGLDTLVLKFKNVYRNDGGIESNELENSTFSRTGKSDLKERLVLVEHGSFRLTN